MRALPTGLLLALALAIPASANAQAGALERALAALPAPAAEALRDALQQAAARGLPTDPLLNKALEGTAKGAPAERILLAVRELAVELEAARDALPANPRPSSGELTATADVMRRGVSPEAVRQLARGRTADEPFELALHTLGDLVERGLPVEVALEILSTWREDGVDAERLRTITPAVDRLTRAGMTPERAGREVARDLGRGTPVTPPAAGRGRRN
jgi:hypothetical protein